MPLTNCSADLRSGGYCLSPCTRYNTDQFCCRGAFGTAQTCNVSQWPESAQAYVNNIHAACPREYAYAYVDTVGLHTCPTGASYTITFCPSGGGGGGGGISPTAWYNVINQFMIQRVLGAKDMYHARMGIVLAGYLKILMPVIVVLPGLIMFARFPEVLAQYRRRWQYDVQSTYFKDNWMGGNHSIKFGWVSERESQHFKDEGFLDEITLAFRSASPLPNFTTPYRVTLRNTPRETTNSNWHHGAYLNDSIQVNPKVP